jgi:uncharacterized protein (TIGR03437 family)
MAMRGGDAMKNRCLARVMTWAILAKVICSLAGAATAATTQPAGWQVLYQQDFENGVPPEWNLSATAGSGTGWSLKTEAGNTYLSAVGHVTAAASLGPWTDFRFKTRVRMIDDGVHLNFRTSGCSRYLVAFHTWGFQIAATYADCAAGGGILKSVPGNFALNTWYTVEILGVGSTIDVYVNGQLQMEYVDPTPLLTGSISLECLSQADFDDIEISGPPQPVTPSWTKVGGPIGGIGYDIKIRPDNPDVMYVTDANSGLHLSTDGGLTWAASNQGISIRTGPSGDSVPIFCATVDPNHPDTVWVGTQNANGVFKSVDGGKTWTSKNNGINLPTGISFRGISVDPHNSSVVYAAGQIPSFIWAGHAITGREFDLAQGFVYKSTDGGDNWTQIWRGDNLARYVVIDPRDSGVLYVSTGIFDSEAANSDMLHGVSGGVGILKTTDGGQSWRVLNGVNGLTSLYIGSLKMHPTNPAILLAGAGLIGLPAAGIFVSTDEGEHWHPGVDTAGHVIQDTVAAVAIAPSSPRTFYAAGSNQFYRSDDGGGSWRPVARMTSGFYGPPGARMGVPIDLLVDPRNPDRIFINNYGGGNFLSEDGGVTWQVASKGYTGAQLHRVAVDPTDEANVFVVGRSGPFRSADRGGTWVGLASGPASSSEWYSVAVNPAHPTTVLISDEFTGDIFRSANSGADWQTVYHHPQNASPTERWGFKALAFAPSNPNTVYAGMSRDRNSVDTGTAGPSFGVFKSTDGGTNWRESNDAVSKVQNINVLLVDPANENTVYAGTLYGGILESRDGGATWQQTNQGLKLLDVRALAMDWSDHAVLYAGVESGGVYKSTDGGATWQISAAGMDPQSPVRDIVVDPTNAQIVYAGVLTSGVFRSDDGGKLWRSVTSGLSMRSVTALAISRDGGTLYAATYGGGVFRLDLLARTGTSVGVASAASFAADATLAPASIASAFGGALADRLETAPAADLPAAIGGTSLSVTDAAGVEKAASLYFVAPGQINFVVPEGLAAASAVVRVFRQGTVVARGDILIENVAPGIFAANGNGQGAPAAIAVRYGADGSQTVAPVFQCGVAAGSCTPAAMDLGAPSEQLILMLYGTGIRGFQTLPVVTIGGVAATVLGAAAQSQYPGLDQVNVLVPRELKGSGDVDLLLKVDGKAANVVRVRIL